MSVELLKVKKYPQTRKTVKVFESDKLNLSLSKTFTKPKVMENLKRPWKNPLKSLKEYEPIPNL